jgi:hypothetical protein
MDDLEQWWKSTDPESWPEPYDLTPADVEAEIQYLQHLRVLLFEAREYADCDLSSYGYVEKLDQLIADVDKEVATEGKRLRAVKARDAQDTQASEEATDA